MEVVCCLPVCGDTAAEAEVCFCCVCVYKHTVALTLFCHTLVNQSLIKYPFRGAGLGEVPLVVGMQDRACVCVCVLLRQGTGVRRLLSLRSELAGFVWEADAGL